ncbi:HDL419Wp [Eremothecium sinecaudum]|uniref:HDL419Wp n=1 Tax=Eremothecium sinecaudum TaxID=45286 RepID=A0A120K238_9SACH|nr:HDL419Wp [Eremothecium sinecaudum]AMD20325.1 HDL419Wp [Eremothecium sinecaudum]
MLRVTGVYNCEVASPSVPNLTTEIENGNGKFRHVKDKEGNSNSSVPAAGAGSTRRRTRSLQREDNLSLLDLYDGFDELVEGGVATAEESYVKKGGPEQLAANKAPVEREVTAHISAVNGKTTEVKVLNGNSDGRLAVRGRGYTVSELQRVGNSNELQEADGSSRQKAPLKNESRQLFMSSAMTVGSINTVPISIASAASTATSVPMSSQSARNVAHQSYDSHYDRYGFKKQSPYIAEGEYNTWWEQYSKYCVRRKHKWKALLAKSGLAVVNDNPDRFPSRSEKLKRYVRKGIPAEWRGNAWWYFARGQEKLNKNKGVYDKLLARMEEPNDHPSLKDLDVIERDLNRTFPDNIHFQRPPDSEEEAPMIKSLRRVLVAFSIYNPRIGYCQSMNFLAGLLLLFMDEERAFWMLVTITSRYLPGVHNVNLEGVNVDQGVLLLCIKEYLPEFWNRIYPASYPKKATNSNDFLYRLPPMTLCTASWFMSCFVGTVPIETTLRIWDCLFYEESHILFKISLSIIKLSEPEFPQRQRRTKNKDDEDMEIFQIIQTFPKSLIDPNEIFDKVIFKKRLRFNSLNQEEIDRCRKYVISQRQKLKNFTEVVGNCVQDNGRDLRIHHDIVTEALSSEEYGFRRSLTGIHWNNSIKERVRQLSKRR